MVRSRRAALLVLACALAAPGCGGPGYEVAEVDGVIRIGGKPGNKIRVQFYPEQGTNGPLSTAETDAEGRFTLTLSDPKGPRPGAVVGWHRVVLGDLRLAESETGKGVPVRLGTDYLAVGTTPLKREVTKGKQTVEIDIPGK